MFGFDPDQEQSMLVQAVRRFAVDDLQPAAHEADEQAELPNQLLQMGWELGLVQAGVDEGHGGLGGASAVTSVLALEELGFGDAAAALAILTPSLFISPLNQLGTDEQKARWLPPITQGPWQPYSAAWIEPNAGFSLGQPALQAASENGHYLLTGRKAYVPFANEAPALLVHAMDEEGPALFIVEQGAEGMQVGERQLALGLHGLPLYPVEFEAVKLDKASRLPGSEEAHARLRAATQVGAAAIAIGLSRAAYEYALAYAKDRVAFGEPIAHKQSIAFMLAEMATEIEAIRLLTWEAAWLLDSGAEAGRPAYLAHIGAADMAMMVTDRAVQILGGHGYIRDHPVERWMRNGRGVAMMPGLVTV